ncbi:unnamed protein product [Dimorphilus gyrociliatus]|uniref:Uncharacterized protein n=1 Tax=Dimorphilus gyrociliatus TaxID=2664684 RepID=A0A7I8V535_9ANNE|nr:unnamed protein product [Dimorphilus gyrociliatus]
MKRPKLLPLVLPKILRDEDKINGNLPKEIRGRKFSKKKINSNHNNSILLGYPKHGYSLEKDKENWSLVRQVLRRPPRYESSFSVSPLGKPIPCPVDTFSTFQGQRSNKLILPQIFAEPKRDGKEAFEGFYLDSTERSSQKDVDDLLVIRARQRAEFEKRMKKKKKLKETHKLRTEDIERSLICARLNSQHIRTPETVDQRYRLQLNNYSTEAVLSKQMYKHCYSRRLSSLRAPPTTPNYDEQEPEICFSTPMEVPQVNQFDYSISMADIPNTSP